MLGGRGAVALLAFLSLAQDAGLGLLTADLVAVTQQPVAQLVDLAGDRGLQVVRDDLAERLEIGVVIRVLGADADLVVPGVAEAPPQRLHAQRGRDVARHEHADVGILVQRVGIGHVRIGQFREALAGALVDALAAVVIAAVVIAVSVASRGRSARSLAPRRLATRRRNGCVGAIGMGGRGIIGRRVITRGLFNLGHTARSRCLAPRPAIEEIEAGGVVRGRRRSGRARVGMLAAHSPSPAQSPTSASNSALLRCLPRPLFLRGTCTWLSRMKCSTQR